MNARAITTLGSALARAGFSARGLEPLLGAPDARVSEAEQEALWAFRARGREPAAILARCFLLQRPTTNAELRRALGADGLAAATGLRWIEGGRPRVQLSLHGDLVIASDAQVDRPPRAFVQAPTTATMLLERLLLPAGDAARTLDLGTGTGYLALRLAGRASGATVIGSDIAPRALAFARANAALNGLPTVRFVRADGLAGFGRQRFDRIVGNLPFVLSPERRFTYRDGTGSDFLASAVRGLRARLAPGGHAQYLGQWAVGPRHDEELLLARLAVAARCDALVLRLDSEPIDVHAARWSAGPGHIDTAERLRRLARWCSHHAAAGVERIVTGLLTLRRRDGARHGLVIDDLGPGEDDGNAVARRLAVFD